jgi:hypothetical protein
MIYIQRGGPLYPQFFGSALESGDVNSVNFPRYSFPKPNRLSASELSMKDLIDELQIQTILNNNIAPYVKKEIKSEVTSEMIKDFQNENAKPVMVNGTLYKFRPPEVDIDLQAVPPDYPDEATYQAEIDKAARPIFREIKNNRIERQDIEDRNNFYFNEYRNGMMTQDNYYRFLDTIEPRRDFLDEEFNQLELARESLNKDYFGYAENRAEYVAEAEKIKAENKKQLATYEDELKSRNMGQSRPQAEDESDEEYKQRLLDTGKQVVDPKTVEIQAQSYLYSTMKDRLSEMLQAYKVEAVLNKIIKDNGYDGLQVIKDRWPSLKKKLTETFGDLQRVNTDSIASFLLNEPPSYTQSTFSSGTKESKAPPAPVIPVSRPLIQEISSINYPENLNPSKIPIDLNPSKIPVDLMPGNLLKEILASNGFNFETGSSLKSKESNYENALQRGLIPDRPNLLAKSKIMKMDTPTLK